MLSFQVAFGLSSRTNLNVIYSAIPEIHVVDAFFFITELGYYPLALGVPWLRYHDVNIQFVANKVTFDSEQCRKHHNAYGRPTWIKGLVSIPEQRAPNKMVFIGCAALLHLHRKRKLEIQ